MLPGYAAVVSSTHNPTKNPMNRILSRLLALCFVAALLAAPAIVSAQSAPPSAPAKARPEKKEKAAPKVDLNTATKEQLAKLPGLDEAAADKIIAARPFTNKTQLKSKKIISDATYEAIKDLTVARQPKTSGAKKENKKNKPE
jgi:DNA uptake protein ComE-like DNA-binding protein